MCPVLCQGLCDSFPQHDISLLCCRRGNTQQHGQQQQGPVGPPHVRRSPPHFMSISTSRCEINTPLENRRTAVPKEAVLPQRPGLNCLWLISTSVFSHQPLPLTHFPQCIAQVSFPTMHCSPLLSVSSDCQQL